MSGRLSRLATKPHYVFHPGRALKRALYNLSGAPQDHSLHLARLPWGLSLQVYRSDAIGFSILTGRVFDPPVTETMYRLIDGGDRVVDVGANVGYLTSLAAARSGPGGVVIAYEPHPTVFELLAANVARWSNEGAIARVETHRVALSDHAGTGELETGAAFSRNTGLGRLADGETPASAETVTVPMQRLDDAVGSEPIGMLKIDVEGFEAGVLRGAETLLASRTVRDIVFEDHDDYPSPATEIVEAAGYRLLHLDNGLLGIRLREPRDRGEPPAWPGPSYLATREPERALARLQPLGWQVRAIGPGLRWRGRSPVPASGRSRGGTGGVERPLEQGE